MTVPQSEFWKTKTGFYVACANLHKVTKMGSALLLLFSQNCIFGQESAPDIVTIEPDLKVPPMKKLSRPAGGRRVRQVHPDWKKDKLYHALYLPPAWKPGNESNFPVVIELPGNGGYMNGFGDKCTGRPEDCKFGFGLTAGKGAIWASVPFVNAAGDAVSIKWWGDSPQHDPAPTVKYVKAVVHLLCKEFGGDAERVLLVGFSRGALACNYIGLHDDEIANLWCGMVPYSHYDGVHARWPYQNDARESALIRLRRLGSRPQFICHENSTNSKVNLAATRTYLDTTGVKGNFTLAETGFRNHNDAWILRPSPVRSELRKWLAELWR